MTFGEFIAERRKVNGLLYRDIAKALGVSTVYVSDIEKGRKNSFKKDKLEILAAMFDLSSEDKNLMFDLAGKQRNMVPPDLLEYIMERYYVRIALRSARDHKADEADWDKAIEIFEEQEKGDGKS